MKLKKEVLTRLILAKSILSGIRGWVLAQPNAHLVAKQVLNAHDAADLTFAAIAYQKGKLAAKGRSPSMIECLDLIGRPGLHYAAYFKQLNDARNSLKHVGNLPNTTQWATVGNDTSEKLSSICLNTLKTLLEDIDETDLLDNEEVKGHIRKAKRAHESGNFKLALEEIGKALFVSLDERGDLIEILPGEGKAEDALKLTGFGISANEFLRLQEFLPMVNRVVSEPFEVTWKQTEFGHPGNWTTNIVEFCLDALLDIALKIQSAPSVPSAVSFKALYEYKVTAEKDKVEVWKDFVEGQLDHDEGLTTRPFREHKRFLNKGESITVTAYVECFVSDDKSISNESIRRVRISNNEGFESLLPPHEVKAEFVNLKDVYIVCVPKTIARHRFPDLPEIPWEDPNAAHDEFWRKTLERSGNKEEI